MDELKELLLQAPDGQLDKGIKPLIEKWSEPPKALEVLEVLDQCVHGGLASPFTMMVIENIMNEAIKTENTKYEEVVKQATWRT